MAALRRRQAAARRCPPLLDGRVDPHHDDRPARVTTAEVHSWRAAWAHLLALGYRVDVPADVATAGQAERAGAAR